MWNHIPNFTCRHHIRYFKKNEEHHDNTQVTLSHVNITCEFHMWLSCVNITCEIHTQKSCVNITCEDHMQKHHMWIHPSGVKCAGTAIILPWNSHIHYAGTAYASPAIPTSAIKNALEQPWRKTGQPRLWLFQRIFLWLFPPDCSRVTVPASLFPRGCSPVVIMDVPEWMF